MGIYETIHGTAYTSDADYAALTGRVTYRHEVVGITLDGWKVKHIVTYTDIGKAAPVAVTEADLQLNEEQLPNEGESERRAQGYSLAILKRQDKVNDVLADYLRQHGPSTVKVLAGVAGCSVATLCGHLQIFTGTYRCYGGKPLLWGLQGQQLPEPPPPPKKPSGYIARVSDALLAHGPMTDRQICEVTGIYRADLQRMFDRNPDLFVVNGRTKIAGKKPARIWGIRKQEAA